MQIQCIVNQPDRLLLICSSDHLLLDGTVGKAIFHFQFPISNFNSMQSRRWLSIPLTAFAPMKNRVYVCQLLTQNSHSHAHPAIHITIHPRVHTHTHTHHRMSEYLSKYPTIRGAQMMGMGIGSPRASWLFRQLNSLQLMLEFVLILIKWFSRELRAMSPLSFWH